MSTRTLDGTYTTFVSNVRSNANARYGAIGVIGHMVNGVTKDNENAETAVPALSKFTASNTGTIYTFSNFAEAAAKLGTISKDAPAYIAGTFDMDGADTSGYDKQDNLIRALELIYLANPNATTRVAVLTGSGASAATAHTGDGVDLALAELTKYDDISYIVGAGMDYNTKLRNHAKTASNVTNKAERIYVGGTSLNSILSGTSFNVNAELLGNQVANQDDSGRGINVLANVSYKFQSTGQLTSTTKEIEDSDGNTTNVTVLTGEGEIEIGGNYFAAYVAGALSGMPEQQSLLRQNPGFIQTFNGSEYRFSNADLEDLVDANMLVIRNSNNRNSFTRALTFSSSGGEFQRITKRRIVDRVSKELRATADTFVGRPNTSASRLGMQSSLSSKMTTLATVGMIDGASTVRVFVNDGDIDAGVVRVAVVFRPVTEIEFVEIQQTVEI